MTVDTTVAPLNTAAYKRRACSGRILPRNYANRPHQQAAVLSWFRMHFAWAPEVASLAELYYTRVTALVSLRRRRVLTRCVQGKRYVPF